MGKIVKVEKSDDIEIISIGKLYKGPWDKKYWSSSRGKDRHPYPIGYKSLRTQNGTNCTMEILEGLKGPSFVISSIDGTSCSGDTPDIAWERFQKKSCSKLWHGKRFSCRMDGVEFFGFKNTFVQRLLRELVANLGGAAERSLQPSNFSLGACEPTGQFQSRGPNPDSNLLKFLSTSHVTRKRSRSDKNCNNKRLNRTHVQHQQEKCTENVNASNSEKSYQPNSGNWDPSTFVSDSEFHNIPALSGPENSTLVIEDEKHLSIAEGSMQVDSSCKSNHLKGESALPEEERELTLSLNHLGSNVDNLLQKPEPNDRSRDAQERINLIPHERGGVTNVGQDLPVVSDADLCAPDTLDHADSSSLSSPENDMQVHLTVKDANANDGATSEVLVTDSSPEDETGRFNYNSSAKTCDDDSVGEDIAKSMMTVLLPRALPLLKTFSRKKKKNAKPPKPLADISTIDGTIARELPEHSYSESKNENAVLPCAQSAISASGNANSVVPYSFDSDDRQDLLIHADAAKADQASCSLNHHVQLPSNVNAEASLMLCHAGIGKQESGISDLMVEDTPDVEEIAAHSKSALDNPSISALLIEEASRPKCIPEKCEAGFAKLQKDAEVARGMVENKINDDSSSNYQQKLKLKSKLACIPELFASYVHPMSISMVQLIIKDDEIFICVKCGYLEQKECMLFVYKAIKYGEQMGCPSLSGYVPIAFQISTNALSISVERSLLQLTPDAQSIVLLNSIKTPYCREGKIHCLCQACTSDSGKNAVKIVKLNSGYASLVTRLETTHGVCCLLVCEPNFLLAAEESGKLRLWVMNSEWSGQVEDWYLPTFDCPFPSIVEMKIVPKSSGLVVGHNGLGEFALWDIGRRNLVSRFSSPGISVLECIPVSIFSWQRKAECKTEVLMDEIMNATKTWSLGRNKNHFFLPEDKDAAVWLLISTVPDPDSQCYGICEEEPTCWRLALLINNKVITGSTVYGSAASVTCEGHGIIGRRDGSIHVWELTTGTKLETLHSLQGSKVSCMATDASNSGALAIACGVQLMVYMSS